MTIAAVEAVDIGKAYGGVAALTKASFTASAGEVHALVGENGAGKSTLIKIMGGRVRPDTGEIRIGGQAVSLAGPQAAHQLGAWTVFQELTLLPWMTVAENLLLRQEPRAFGLIDRKATLRDADALLARFGVMHIDPRALVEDISLAERQTVEIVRAVSHAPKILFLDEPTSSLVEREVEWLFGQIRRLREQGCCIVFTSHRWAEIRSIADRITIFRGGQDVGTFTDIDEDEAVRLMTGRRVEALYPAMSPAPDDAPVMMEARALSGPNLRQVSFALRRGEVLGVGGLAGHGHRELFRTVFGDAHASGGTLSVQGKEKRFRSPRAAIASGIALVPEDRKSEGLLLRMSVRDNASLAILKRLTRFGILKPQEERRAAQHVVDSLRVRTAGIGLAVGALSGGNQQKVLLGRWLETECQILLLYDVTRGVDVATKHEIYELVVALARDGHAILFYSSDAEELAHLCHRVLVMREGVVAAELRAPGVTAEDIVSAAVRDHRAA
ncbi:sugar ABC transporter ATP-binding protein [Acidisoma cellulosilytica]|uniref:Sugar ABC transporter ATP-binding protein n=1 Tax=Acidisoma cellulosilyticum TaxID=2802395 RepID=A0A964E300_9PROT|nr:sugar ABC transporter ATP-binding protein [Acidisoma cellulosilyticum]MCB8880170.1 sugar ABC transporter ATP-binding protein [Acidisoma cellulosilyticum]